MGRPGKNTGVKGDIHKDLLTETPYRQYGGNFASWFLKQD